MRQSQRGQILPIVIATLFVLIIVIVGLVNWIQNDTNWAVKEQKSSTAINFAEAGIDRGAWKLQSSTNTWFAAAAGTIINGYNFDTTYSDVPGGTYRIKFTAGTYNTLPAVTVTAEGRDSMQQQVRALSVIYTNQTIYSGLMSGGNVTWSPGLGLFWGPIIAQGNITLQNGIDAWYFPQKYAKGVVLGTAANPRDTNGLIPPNTDNVEWWSDYAGVPNVPILDFVTLRSSAAATGTLNIYGCKNSTNHGANNSLAGPAPWDLNSSCNGSAPHTNHFGNSTNYIKTYLDPTQNYVWYWDGDVEFDGQFNGSNQPYSPGRSTGLMGTIVVRGNLTMNSPGDFIYTGHVPNNAWQQEQKLLQNTYDTAASNEYPADIGYHKSASTFCFGYTCPGTCIPYPPTNGSICGAYATVGVRGFVYVGGNLTITSYMDIHGGIWVNGNVNASGGSYGQFTSVFYDDTLSVPALNVILMRQSWQEATPSPTAWN
jgi:hypothetical protein